MAAEGTQGGFMQEGNPGDRRRVVVVGHSRLHTESLARSLTGRGLAAEPWTVGRDHPDLRDATLLVAGDLDDAAWAQVDTARGACRGVLAVAGPWIHPMGAVDRVLPATMTPADLAAALAQPDGARPRSAPEISDRGLLSRRETQVLRCLADGASNAEIATRLQMSPHTARTHVQNLLHKLGTPNRAAAVAVGRRERLL